MDGDSLFASSEYLATVNFILKRRMQFEFPRQTFMVFSIFYPGFPAVGKWRSRNFFIWR